MKPFTTLIAFIFFAQVASAQNLRPSVAKIVNKLLSYELLYQRCVGHGCSKISYPYSVFVKLQNTATIKELLFLSQHDSSRIKAYAGWALINRKYQHLDSIFLRFWSSKETVLYAEGDTYPIKDDLAHEFYRKLSHKANGYYTNQKSKLFYRKQFLEIKRHNYYPGE